MAFDGKLLQIAGAVALPEVDAALTTIDNIACTCPSPLRRPLKLLLKFVGFEVTH